MLIRQNRRPAFVRLSGVGRFAFRHSSSFTNKSLDSFAPAVNRGIGHIEQTGYVNPGIAFGSELLGLIATAQQFCFYWLSGRTQFALRGWERCGVGRGLGHFGVPIAKIT